MSDQKALLDLVTSNRLVCAPRQRLPSGTVQLRVHDEANTPLKQAAVTARVIEGGGGFRVDETSEYGPCRAEATLASDDNGTLSLPDFVVGPGLGTHRFVVESHDAQLSITLQGSYERLAFAAPAPPIPAFCRDRVVLPLQLIDSATGQSAWVTGALVAVEIVAGGGFIEVAGRWLRGARLRTDCTGALQVPVRVSSRAETITLRAWLVDAPAVACEKIQIAAQTPLFGPSGAVALDFSSGGGPILPGVGRFVPFSAGNGKTALGLATTTKVVRGAVDVRESDVRGRSDALEFRVTKDAAFVADVRLADFPDSPVATVTGRMGGGPPSPLPALGAEVGVALDVVSGGLQYAGPGGPASAPLVVDVVMSQPNARHRPPAPPEDQIAEVLLAVGVDLDGNISPWQLPAIDPRIAVAGAAEVGNHLSIPFAPGARVAVTVAFAPNDSVDHTITVSARVRLHNGAFFYGPSGGTSDLVSALDVAEVAGRFLRPRLRIVEGDSFAPVGENAIRPCTVVDTQGNPLSAPRDRHLFVELTCRDVGSTVNARLRCGAEPLPAYEWVAGSGGPLRAWSDGWPVSAAREYRVALSRVTHTPEGVVYRSPPLACHLEQPEAFGVDDLPDGPDGARRIWLPAPYTVTATLDDNPFGETPQQLESDPDGDFRTATRPAAVLLIEPLTVEAPGGGICPSLPAPSLELDLSPLGKPVSDASAIEDAFSVTVASDGKRSVSLKAAVRDPVADLLPKGAGPQSPVTVTLARVDPGAPAGAGPSTVAVTPFTDEPVSPLRPHPWRGELAFDLSLDGGPVAVYELTAKNLLGATTTRTIRVEAADATAAAPATSVVVHVPDAAPAARPPELVLVTYHSPAAPIAGGAPDTVSATVQSALAGASAPDKLDVTLTRAPSTKEATWVSSPILVVLDTVDITACRQLGIPVVRHTAGGRLDATATGLPHAGGPLDLHAATPSTELEVRLLRLEPDGTFREVTLLGPEDRFTVEARLRSPRVPPDLMLTVAACDRLGRVLAGDGRLRRLLLKPPGPPAPGDWMRLCAVLDDDLRLTTPRCLAAVFRVADANSDEVALRVLGAGAIRVGTASDPGFTGYLPVVSSRPLFRRLVKVLPPGYSTDPDPDEQVEAWAEVPFTLSVQQRDGSFLARDRIEPGDTFTIDATPSSLPPGRPAFPFAGLEVLLRGDDPYGLLGDPVECMRRLLLAPTADPGKLRLKSYLAPDGTWKDVPSLLALDTGQTGGAAVGLRVGPRGMLVADAEFAPSNRNLFPFRQIEHIVVLALENRGFDHLLGWLYEGQTTPSHALPANPPPSQSGLRPFEGLDGQDLQNPFNGIDPITNKPLVKTFPPKRGARASNVPRINAHESFIYIMQALFNQDPSVMWDPKLPPGDARAQRNKAIKPDGKSYLPPSMNGWVASYADSIKEKVDQTIAYEDQLDEIMDMYVPEQLPVLNGLARHYAVSDQWFCSVPSQTTVNRAFMLGGCSAGLVTNNFYDYCLKWVSDNVLKELPVLTAWGVVLDPVNPMAHILDDIVKHEADEKKVAAEIRSNETLEGGSAVDAIPGRITMFDVLSLNKVGWRYYWSAPALPPAWFLPPFGRVTYLYLSDPQYDPHFPTINTFYNDAISGINLKSVSFIEPILGGGKKWNSGPFFTFANDFHPAGDSFAAEFFVKSIYDALSLGRKWQQTMLVVTFDENGGTYDHFPPPPAVRPGTAAATNTDLDHAAAWCEHPELDPTTQTQFGFEFDLYGCRVPAIVISPYVRPQTVFRSPVDKVPFDHTSIIATIMKFHGIDYCAKGPPTPKAAARAARFGARVANAPTLELVLDGDPRPMNDPGTGVHRYDATILGPRGTPLRYGDSFYLKYLGTLWPPPPSPPPPCYLGQAMSWPHPIGMGQTIERWYPTLGTPLDSAVKFTFRGGGGTVANGDLLEIVADKAPDPQKPATLLAAPDPDEDRVYFSSISSPSTKWRVWLLRDRAPTTQLCVDDQILVFAGEKFPAAAWDLPYKTLTLLPPPYQRLGAEDPPTLPGGRRAAIRAGEWDIWQIVAAP